MKWDGENKEKLRLALEGRFRDMIRPLALRPSKVPAAREEFLGRFSIMTARRRFGTKGWPCWYLENDEKAANKDRVIIPDPWMNAVFEVVPIDSVQKKLYLCTDGLSIPKEVAERFLVLGVP